MRERRHRGQWRSAAVFGCLAATAAGLATADLRAQDRNPANELRFGLSTTLRHDSNENLSATPTGSTTRFTTTLKSGLTWQSPVSLFDFSLDTRLRYIDSPSGTTTDAEIPGLRLYFEREGARSKLTAQARLNETDLTGLTTLVDPITGDLLTVEDPGRRRSFSVGTTLDGGIGTPLETRLSLTRSGTRYLDTISPSYYDSDRWAVETQATAVISPVLSVTAGLSFARYEAEDAFSTRRETTSGNLSLNYAIDPVTTLTTGLGYTEIDQTGAGTLSNQTGATYSLGLTRQVATGQVGLSYNRSIENNGARNQISLSGDLELPRGSLSGSIGYLETAQANDGVTTSLDYTHALIRGSITLGASRSFYTTDAGFDQLVTQLRAGWNYEINSLSQIGLSANYSAVDNTAPGVTDTSRTTIGLSYDYRLTSDWSLSSGVQHRIAQREGQPDATSNAVFVTLSRDFSFRF